MATRDAITGESRGDRRRAGLGASQAGMLARADEGPARGGRVGLVLAAGLAVLIVAWAVLNLVFGQIAVALVSPDTNASIRTISMFDKLFSALVLFLLAADVGRRRLRWVAAGFVVLGLGRHVVFDPLQTLLGVAPDLDTQAYGKLIIWTTALALFVVGLLPDASPRLSWRRGLAILAGFVALSAATLAAINLLPSLVEGVSPWDADDVVGHALLPGLTGWHFAFFVLPPGLAIVAAAGAMRRDRGKTVGGWLIVAMVLVAGSQLHDLFWPVPHPEVLSSTRVLHFAFSATAIVGGILELRRIAAERSALLAAEEERTRHLRELAVLKADFTAMVAHELGTPLAAIQGYTDMLATGEVPSDLRTRTLAAIQTETDALKALIADVRVAASTEREDFAVERSPVKLDDLLEDATTFIRAFDGGNPIKVEAEVHGRVLADAERIGQVLRNLLSNAAKYSEPGTSIELRATGAEDGRGESGRVRIEVADRGRGIHPDDLERIFEKFGRGRDQSGQKVAGAGLGLYLSRRIVRAHGSDLTVRSTPGKGSVFAFELEVAR